MVELTVTVTGLTAAGTIHDKELFRYSSVSAVCCILIAEFTTKLTAIITVSCFKIINQNNVNESTSVKCLSKK